MKTKKCFYFFCLLLTTGTASAVPASCGEDDPAPPPFAEMVTVAGGTTTLNRTEVTISGFQIGKYEVTQKQWWDVMGSWPGTGDRVPSSRYGVGDNYPMYYVSHDDIQSFLTALNNKTGKNYRLPTEAEWEYAAKGGRSTRNYEYSGSDVIGSVAWYSENSYALGESSPDYGTHAVGTKLPNELGIYDMGGNVWEWCSDWHDDTYPSSTTNPTGATTGLARVARGGGWSSGATYCRVSNRSISTPGYRSFIMGFRLALPL